MMRATAKASLTGINRLDRNLTKPPPGKPLKHVILTVAVGIRADRICHGAAGTVEALTGVDVIALLVEVSEEVKRGNRVTAAVQVAGACPQAVVPEAEDIAVAGLAAVAAEVAAVGGSQT
jgi:hypothetical protein